MSTTEAFQKRPDFYPSKLECEKSKQATEQTNPRYKRFCQTHFTAGDEEQFETYRDATTSRVPIYNISTSGNVFDDLSIDVWEKYKGIGADAVANTFRYMFHKFKKGIFVKIVDNKVRVFLPFSKAHYVNEWSHKIHVDRSRYSSVKDFVRVLTTAEGYRFDPRAVNDDISQWYGNNCLVRYEYPPAEGDTNTGSVKDMLDVLCRDREIPDIEFFLNRRDFPVLTRDGTEPYNNIWDSMEQPLVSHRYTKYVPILSMSVTSRYADIPIPTCDDWARVQNPEGKWFPKLCRDYPDTFDTPWENKVPTAVFRGGSTGCGVTIKTNPRLRLVSMSVTQPESADGVPYLDAGITNWNLRARKVQGEPYLTTINPEDLGFELAPPMSPEQQSQYKYIVNVDGHVTAFRLSLELNMGSVILLVDSPWKIWYSKMLEPYIHYVPVKYDMSNLFEQIEWCRQHDGDCSIIADNARDFYRTYLQKKGVIDYMQKLLVTMRRETGTYFYNSVTPLDSMISLEYSQLDFSYPPLPLSSPGEVLSVPLVERSWGLLGGVEWMIRKIIKEGDFESSAVEHEEIFCNKLGRVRRFSLAGFSFAVKTTENDKKSKEHIHEAFVGTKSINDVIKHIPNFAYTFGLYRKSGTFNVVSEHIPGQNLFDYIASDRFDFGEFLFITVQICLAVQTAQDLAGLVHYDLTPWNIVLRRLDESQQFDYVLGDDKIVRIQASIIPVIIDYGKAHVVHDDIHHGFVEMFRVCQIQDIITFLVVSIDQIAHQKHLVKSDLKGLFHLANFVSGTGYRHGLFETTKDIRAFFKRESKYAEIIRDNKHELKNKEPYDLINHIMKLRKTYQFRIGLSNTYKPMMNRGNKRQVFEYIFSRTREDRTKTYTDALTRFVNCDVPQPVNPFFARYGVQQLALNITSLWNDAQAFARQCDTHVPLHKKLFDEATAALEGLGYSIPEEQRDVSISETSSNLISAPYSTETFLDPSHVAELLAQSKEHDNPDYSDCKEIIVMTLLDTGAFALTETEKSLYRTQFAGLLTKRGLFMKNNNANRETLSLLAKRIYSSDLRALKRLIDEETGETPAVRHYMDLYKRLS